MSEEFSLSYLLAQRADYLAEAKDRLSPEDYKFAELITLAATLVTDESVANVSRHLEIGYDEAWAERECGWQETNGYDNGVFYV